MKPLKAGAAMALFCIAAPAIAQPVAITTKVMVETRKPAPDGTTRIVLMPAARVTPGDRVVYQISYRNSGAQPARDLVIANPVPAGLVYAGVANGTPAPELSVDGTRFGTLAQLSVRGRPATAADVRVVRWRVASLAGGTTGQVSYRATLK